MAATPSVAPGGTGARPDGTPPADAPPDRIVPADPRPANTVSVGDPAAGERDPRRWLVFGVLSVAFMMSSIDQTIVATALPTMREDLHASLSWIGWTLTIYALGRVIVLPLSGRLSDLYSRRAIFIGAVSVFTLASLACGLAGNIYILVAMRAIQSIGGGAFQPSATGIVSDRFGPDRDRAIGMFSSIFPIGGVIGPALGGVFVTYWSWRGIFLVNVPIGAILVIAAVRLLPADRRGTGRVRPDLRGMALLVIGILGAMLAITYLGDGVHGIADPRLLVPAAVAIGSGVLLVVHVRRTDNPFIPPSLLHGRGLGVLGGMNFVYGGAALGLAALVPLYASQRYGIGTLASGTLLTARSIGIMLVAGAAAWAMRRTGYRKPISIGFATTASGLIMLALPATGLSPYAWLAVGAALTGVGMGLATPSTNNAAIDLAPDQASAISGLRAMFRQAGSITAISLTTAILARSSDPGLAQAWVCVAYALILLCVIPMVRLIPEHRGRW